MDSKTKQSKSYARKQFVDSSNLDVTKIVLGDKTTHKIPNSSNTYSRMVIQYEYNHGRGPLIVKLIHDSFGVVESKSQYNSNMNQQFSVRVEGENEKMIRKIQDQLKSLLKTKKIGRAREKIELMNCIFRKTDESGNQNMEIPGTVYSKLNQYSVFFSSVKRSEAVQKDVSELIGNQGTFKSFLKWDNIYIGNTVSQQIYLNNSFIMQLKQNVHFGFESSDSEEELDKDDNNCRQLRGLHIDDDDDDEDN